VAGSDDERDVAAPERVFQSRPQRAEHGAGRDDVSENPIRQAERGDDLVRPLPGLRVEELRSRGVRPFHRFHAGEPVGEDIGDKKDVARLRERFAFAELEREEVEGAVVEVRLDAGAAENVVLGHQIVHLFRHALEAGISVLVRRADQLAGVVEEAEVAAPGIDPDGGDVFTVCFDGLFQAGEDLMKQAEDIPVKAGGPLDGGVLEAVDFCSPRDRRRYELLFGFPDWTRRSVAPGHVAMQIRNVRKTTPPEE
jgi:hypothetical protein